MHTYAQIHIRVYKYVHIYQNSKHIVNTIYYFLNEYKSKENVIHRFLVAVNGFYILLN